MVMHKVQSPKPWTTGPAEILQHGLSLLEEDSDSNRRLAMIAIDNSVELALTTYLGLPYRVTKLRIPKKDLAEAEQSFPKLLEATEGFAGDRLIGVDLSIIDFYHRQRNMLYHRTGVLSIGRTMVEAYSQLARILFKNLFGYDVVQPPARQQRLSAFLDSWTRIEKAVAALFSTPVTDTRRVAEGRTVPYNFGLRELAASGILDPHAAKELQRLRELRNRLVHGEASFEDDLCQADAQEAADLAKLLESAATGTT